MSEKPTVISKTKDDHCLKNTLYLDKRKVCVNGVILGTDPPTQQQTTTQQFFLYPQSLKNLISPPGRQKGPVQHVAHV